ncbi:hypothetical protein N7510_004638 [Penicillium lagena]|uniref:uncharacterized protein n=1 Tax=Penicillium lagena TaxID=94218 RepID=UPI002541F24E|nr:uncharacterized protein N7510_004638 [Penicillium lagena]KAJ5620654.1 hypothetical protein N7510_004638 [Penicillium lagena]
MTPKSPSADSDVPPSPRSWVELMAVERLPDAEIAVPGTSSPEKIECFRSLASPFPPGEGTRSFGGHVYAQSAYAASKTVDKGFMIHDMTGSFILAGRLDVPYIYTVRHIRDGKMYCTRSVDARQNGKICFSGLCSFKRDEKQQTFGHQPQTAQQRFAPILNAKRAEEQPLSPSVDADWWIDAVNQGNIVEREFPGLDVRKVDMEDYNSSPEVKDHPEKYRQLTQYRMKGSPDLDPCATISQIREREAEGEYDNLYACAHMYASDKNSLLLIPRALGIKHWTEMASLTLMVIVHHYGPALRMVDWDAVDKDSGKADPLNLPMKWFVQENWTPRSAENRAVHESYLWSPDGTLLATTIQDSMLRLRRLDRL